MTPHGAPGFSKAGRSRIMLAQGTDQLVAASRSGYPRFSATDEWQAATPLPSVPTKRRQGEH